MYFDKHKKIPKLPNTHSKNIFPVLLLHQEILMEQNSKPFLFYRFVKLYDCEKN